MCVQLRRHTLTASHLVDDDIDTCTMEEARNLNFCRTDNNNNNNNNNNESISTAQNKKSSDAPAGIKSFQFLCKCLNRARRGSNVSW